MISRILKFLNNLNVRQVLALAGIAAVLMFAAIYFFLTSYTAKESTKIQESDSEEQMRLTSVVVAKSDIAPRIKIREEMLEIKEMPENDVPSGAIKNKAEIIDLPAKITILAGDVITSRKLYKNAEQTGFVATIPPDCRAISIHVNDVTAVAGFAKPGDFVDLLLVENDSHSATSNIILQNVLLLSINQSMDRNEVEKNGEMNDKPTIENPSLVTVALRPHEVLKLISATKLGEIYLMLRPTRPLDTYVDDIEYKVISANAPTPKEDPPQSTEKPVIQNEPVAEKIQPVIQIIQGDKVLPDTNAENASNSADKK